MSQAYKPSSVADDHLSRTTVTSCLMRFQRAWRATIQCSHSNLAPSGVYIVDKSPSHWWALTPPFHPYGAFAYVSRYLSVALSLESPPPDVIRRSALWCSDFPHPCGRDHLACSLYLGSIITYFTLFRLLPTNVHNFHIQLCRCLPSIGAKVKRIIPYCNPCTDYSQRKQRAWKRHP